MSSPSGNASAAPVTRKAPLWQKIIAVVIVSLAFLAFYIQIQPSDFRVTRSATIGASPEVVFEHVNDLEKWQGWSPWAKLDPQAKATYGEKVAGKDASFTWSGNAEVGEGTMTIIESRPGEFVQYRLDFRKPFVGTSTAEFTLKPEGEKTNVTWAMYGQNDFMGKAMNLLMDCDKMVGGQFEEGLKNLNEVAQATKK
jgi:uncharacterized protein YndB with AHSA1/START domain